MNVASALACFLYQRGEIIVHLHGLAGDLMRETVGEYSLVATDLLLGLPGAFLRTREEAGKKLTSL
jgi:hypothetical protein